MDRTGRILAKRPPLGSLLAFVVYAAIAYGLVWIVRYFIDERARLFDDKEGPIVFFRMGFVAAIAIGALLLMVACARIVQRWTMSSCRISIDGDTIVLRLPRRRRWWMPLLPRCEELRIATAEVRALRILPHDPAVLEIEAGTRTAYVPSKLFSVGVFSLDAALREVIGSGKWPHPTARPDELRRWNASTVVQLAMPIVGVALLVASMALLIATRGAIGKPALVPFVFGLGLLIAVAFYRGRIVLDARGMFFERGGTTTFVAWSELDVQSLGIRSNLLGAWNELRVETAKASTAPQRISLNRILGLGFPLRDISSELERLAPRYR
jgi:hypothetical protein